MNPRLSVALTAVVASLAVLPAAAQDLASFEKRVTLKKLPNGLTVLVVERKEAPVFSYVTRVDVGSAQEVAGITGLAHMFEHMAFKGTDVIGTTDGAAEKAALAKVEEAYAAYDSARRKTAGRDEKDVARLESAWKAAIAEADKFVVPGAFGEIVEREGGVGLNASTSSDETTYFYSMPSNRLELWAYLESERFVKPSLREFYKERDVVMEERRMRTDSRPGGRLLEEFVSAAFIAHPYGNGVIGWASDLSSFSATDAQRFYEQHYVPENMYVAVVGDVKTAETLRLVEEYFGRLPARPRPGPVRTVEPAQRGAREVVLKDPSQPLYYEGYHKPEGQHPDEPVFDVLADLLATGRTSRLYRSLVRDKKLCAAAGALHGFPGNKYPNLFAFYGVTTPGHTADEVRGALQAEIDRLKNEDVPAEELKMVKTRTKADLIRGLGSNIGLARQLSYFQMRFGDWRELFRNVERIQSVTPADIRRVAKATFREENRTVARIESIPRTPAGGAQ